MKLYRIFLLMLCTVFWGCSTPPTVVQLNGTNVAGGEVVWGVKNTDNPVSNVDYLFISHQDIDYLSSKKVNFIRMVFGWEAMQPTLMGPLSTGTYAQTFKDRVDYATSKGITVMVEPHGGTDANFAAYKGNKVGSAAVPNAAFADFWIKMAVLHGSNPRVVYGLSNEPNNTSTMQWFNAAQAAVLGIRSTGSRQMIMVPGNGWTNSVGWTSSWYDTASPQVSNAAAWTSTIKDPINNTVASVHLYLDANGGGTGTDIVSPTIGVDRLTAVVAWARANKIKLHISELGASAANPASSVAVKNVMDYAQSNSDVVLGTSWWAYGPPSWWGSYQFTLDPTSNYTVDDPKMAWLSPYFSGQTVMTTLPVPAPTPTPTPTVVPPSSTFPTAPITFVRNSPIALNSGTTNYAYIPSTYDGTHNTPTSLLVWLHGCGGNAQGDAWIASLGSTQTYLTLSVGGTDGACWSPPGDATKVINAINDMKTHFNVDTRRIVLGGYSSGGDLSYYMAFYYGNTFSGILVENTSPFRDTSSTQAKSLAAAQWKINIVHLLHTSDSVYPIAGVLAETAAVKAAGFPITVLQQPGTHYDNPVYDSSGNLVSGTDFDRRKYLLPYMTAGWTNPGSTVTPTDAGSPVDAGSVVDSGTVVDAGIKPPTDAGVVDSGTVALFKTTTNQYVTWSGGSCSNIEMFNLSKTSVAWHSMNVNVGSGAVRNVANAVATKSGSLWLFKPNGSQWIPVGGTFNVSFCQDGGTNPVVVNLQ